MEINHRDVENLSSKESFVDKSDRDNHGFDLLNKKFSSANESEKKQDSVENGTRSYFMSDDAYQRFVKGELKLGRAESGQETLFSFSKEDADKIFQDSKGSRNYLEDKLGLSKGRFGDGPIHRVDIKFPDEHNLRYANGMEPGANCFFNTPYNEKDRPDIKFINKESNIESITLKTGERLAVDYDSDPEGKGKVEINELSYEVIDAKKTALSEMERLNGRYVTSEGEIHFPNSDGYKGETSGGVKEAVTDRVPNLDAEVHHTTIVGGHREPEGFAARFKEHLSDNGTGCNEREGFRVIDNYTALNDAVSTYQGKVKSIDSENISFEEKTIKLNNLRSNATENIRIDRSYDDTNSNILKGAEAIDEAKKNQVLENEGYDSKTAEEFYEYARKHYEE